MAYSVQISISQRVPEGTASVPSGVMVKTRAAFVVPSGRGMSMVS